MSFRTFTIWSVVVAIVSGLALWSGVGAWGDRVALTLLCWSLVGVPVVYAFECMAVADRGGEDG